MVLANSLKGFIKKVSINYKKYMEVNMKGNVIVGQSGGPTSVINSSLAGVFKMAKAKGYNKVYGMRNGILGLLDERYVDLSEYLQNDLDIEILRRTPGAFLGTCRFKLPNIDADKEPYENVFAILDKLNIECFIYIGGNDSMDTINKLAKYAAANGKKQRFVGCPKTIDNDLVLNDHTPGFGSAAKYIATSVKEIIIDSLGMSYKKKNIVVVEIMGRNAGWLTAASALSKGEDCEGPDMIYLPETVFDMDKFNAKVEKLLSQKDIVVVAISEGIKLADGRYVTELGNDNAYVDSFGHKQLTGTATYLANTLAAKFGCKTRAVEFSTLQRSAAHMASKVDMDEAMMVGEAAVKIADEGSTGMMVAIERVSNEPYQSTYAIHEIDKVANGERTIPREWINEEGDYVTEEFIEYAKPLIEGEFYPYIVNGIPRHLVIK